MSGQMWGADVEELERIAREFRKSADDIDGQGSALTGALNRVAWLGEIATTFLNDWTGVSVPKIGVSTSFLRDAASNLEKQARQQRDASDGLDGLGGASRPPLTPEQRQEVNQLTDQARDQAVKTPAEQLAWWNSLTDEQRALLIAETPGVVMGLDGLPADVRAQATDQYLADEAGKIVVSTEHMTVGGSVDIPIPFTKTKIGLGAEVSVDKTVYADGSVDVEVSGGPVANAALAGLGVDGGPNGTLTYHFDTQAEADAFLRSLKIAGSVAAAAPGTGALGIEGVLALNANHIQSGGAGQSTGASAIYGPASGSVEGSVVASIDRDGNVTLTAAASASGTLATGTDIVRFAATGGSSLPWGVTEMVGTQYAGEIGGSASLTIGSDGTPKSITLTGTIMGGDSAGLHGQQSITHTTGSGTMVSVELDLNDPVLAAHANELADAVKRGDVGAVMDKLDTIATSDVVDRSKITTTTFDSSSTDVSGSIEVAGVGVGLGETTVTSVTIKPPGGEPQVVMGG